MQQPQQLLHRVHERQCWGLWLSHSSGEPQQQWQLLLWPVSEWLSQRLWAAQPQPQRLWLWLSVSVQQRSGLCELAQQPQQLLHRVHERQCWGLWLSHSSGEPQQQWQLLLWPVSKWLSQRLWAAQPQPQRLCLWLSDSVQHRVHEWQCWGLWLSHSCSEPQQQWQLLLWPVSEWLPQQHWAAQAQ